MSEEAAPAPPRRRRWLRWLRWMGALAGLVLLGLGTVLALLATAADRAVVIRQVLELANRQIAGRVELGTAWLFPNGHLIAHDVTLLDPDGGVIARAATIDTHVNLQELTELHLHLTETELAGGALFLATDAEGHLNIAQAFALKHRVPSAPSAPPASIPTDGGGSLSFDVDGAELRIDEARFVVGAGDVVLFDLHQALLRASASMDRAGVLTVEGRSLQAEAVAPLPGPLQLRASVNLTGPQLHVTAEGNLDEVRVTGEADLDVDRLAGEARLSDLSVGPHVLSRWLGGLEPRALRGTARVALGDHALRLESLDVAPTGGAGRLAGTGKLDLATGDAEARVVATGLDARAVLGELPKTNLGFQLDARVAGLFSSSRRLSAHLAVAASTVEGQAVGPGATDAWFSGETLELTAFDLAFPGGRLTGAGTLAGKQVAAQGHLEAPNLAALRGALEGMFGVNLPDFAGRLSSEVAVRGPLANPAWRADVRAPRLSLNGLAAEEVEAHFEATSLGRRMDLHGRATLSRFRVADHLLHDLGVALSWTTPRLHLEAQAQ